MFDKAHLQEVGRLSSETNAKGKEAKTKEQATSKPSITLNESAWGEDSSNRNQYFGSENSQEQKTEEEDKVTPSETSSNLVIPPPLVFTKKRRKKTVDAIAKAMDLTAKKLVPFSSNE